MKRIRIFSIFVLVAMLVVAAVPARNVLAASGTATLGSGTITGIKIVTDPVTHISTVVVSLVGSDGMGQSVRVSLETAVTLNLIVPDALMIGKPVTIVDKIDPTIITTGTINILTFATDPVTLVTSLTVNLTDATLVVKDISVDLETAIQLVLVAPNATLISTAITVDPTLILSSSTFGNIVTKLGNFFGSFGIDFATIQAYIDSGNGYGVVTQALWMTSLLGGNTATFDQIMAAKASGDFSSIVLPDGSSVKNWGSLRKAVITSGKYNLGQIMSGKATPPTTTTTTTTTTTKTTHGNGHGSSNSNTHSGGNGNSSGHGKKP